MRRATSLLLHSLRSHLAGALWCGIGGGIAMTITAASLQREFGQFPGGGAALGAMVTAAAEAMRIMRWPAERLDTLGGYLTYHNVLLLPLLLGIYGAVQGAQALRGSEEKRVLDLWLATGSPRWRVVVDRAAAFGAALAIVALGIGAGTAAGMSLGGDAHVGASFVVAAESALVGAVFYALAVLLSSFLKTSGAAAGITVLVMIGLYLVTNVWELIGPFGAVRFVSPFWLRQRSDMLIPGRELDVVATLALGAMTLVLLAAGGAAFARRDYARALLERPASAGPRRATGDLAWRPTVAIGSVLEERTGILAWALGVAVFMAMFASLIPRIEEMWSKLDIAKLLLTPDPSADFASQLVGLCGEILAPALGAFAIVQSARWVRERTDGRDDLLLSYPITRARYVLQRVGALVIGALVVVAGALAGLAAGAALGDVPLDAAGLARLAGDLVLLTVSVGAVALALVALLRGTATVAILSAWLVAAYLVVFFAPVFEWPDWVGRLSIFDAFGEPYQAMPEVYGIATLAALGVLGVAIAIATLERRRAA